MCIALMNISGTTIFNGDGSGHSYCETSTAPQFPGFNNGYCVRERRTYVSWQSALEAARGCQVNVWQSALEAARGCHVNVWQSSDTFRKDTNKLNLQLRSSNNIKRLPPFAGESGFPLYLLKNVKVQRYETNCTCCFVWVWNLVSALWEYVDIRGGSDRTMAKTV